MSSAVDGDNVPFSRLPLLLAVVEGMLEVGTSQLSELRIKKTCLEVEGESGAAQKVQQLIAGIHEQGDFVELATLNCKAWRVMVASVLQLRQIEKLEAYLKDLAEVHVQLLSYLASFSLFP